MTKGCYVGQEVIIRILHRGQGRVARKLVGIVFEPDDEPPAIGATLTIPRPAGDAQAPHGADPETIGVITSAVRSPALDRPIALGYVKRELATPPTALIATDGTRRLSGVVTPRPFLPFATGG